MKRIGIGGLQSFDAGLRTPQVVDEWLPYMTEGWKEVFRKTTAYADSLDLEFGIAASPGWSETGGPWVTAEDAMKKMAWSVTYVEGGRVFNSRDVEAALNEINLAPDFSYSKPMEDSHVMFIHRRLSRGDIYFLANRVDRKEEIEELSVPWQVTFQADRGAPASAVLISSPISATTLIQEFGIFPVLQPIVRRYRFRREQ